MGDQQGNGAEGASAELRLDELESRARRANAGRGLPLRDWLALAEAWRIANALRDARGNRSAAARALGIGRRTLYSKMERLGMIPARRPERRADGTPACPHGEAPRATDLP